MIIGISGKKSSGKDTVAKLIQCLTCIDDNWFKDSTIEAITKWQGNYNNLGEWKIKKFADKLKEIVSLLTGISVQDLEKEEVKQRKLEDWKVWKLEWLDSYGQGTQLFSNEEDALEEKQKMFDFGSYYSLTLDEFIPEVRYLLQYIGTDLFRNQLHPDVWVNSLFSEYRCIDDTNRMSLGNILDYSKCEFPKWIISDLRFPNELKAIQDRNGLYIRVTRPETDKLAGNHLSETALDDRQDWDWDWVFDNSKDLNHLVDQVKAFVKFYRP